MTKQDIQEAVFEAMDAYYSMPVTVSKSEAARKLGISRNTLLKRIKNGQITATDDWIERTELLKQIQNATGKTKN